MDLKFNALGKIKHIKNNIKFTLNNTFNKPNNEKLSIRLRQNLPSQGINPAHNTLKMTRRQQIIEILQQNKQSAQQLANYFQCELKEILEDLEHIQKSIHKKIKDFRCPENSEECE